MSAGMVYGGPWILTAGLIQVRKVCKVLSLLEERGVLQRRQGIGCKGGARGTVDYVFGFCFVGVFLGNMP